MKKEINSINFKGLIGYLHKNFGDDCVQLLTEGLVNNEEYLVADKYNPSKKSSVQMHHLVDEAYWVSNDFSLNLLANVKKVVPGPNPLFVAGENSVIEVLSKSFFFPLRILGPKFLLKKAPGINKRFNRTKEVKLVESKGNSAVFKLYYKPGYRVTKDVCNWNLGIYSGMARLVGGRGVRIVEEKCVVDGGDCCVFRVSWEKASLTHSLLQWLLRSVSQEVQQLIDDYDSAAEERDQLIDNLVLSEERYRALTDHSLTGIYIIEDDVLVYANDRLARMLGYFPGELIGKKISEFSRHDYQRMVEEMSATSTGDTQARAHYEFCALRKGGDSIWLEVLSTAIESNGRNLNMGNVIDITERKRSEDRYRTIFENTGSVMIIDEKDTTVSLVNVEFEKLFDYSKEEVEGKKSWTEFVVKEDLERIKEYHLIRRKDPDAAPRNYEFRAVDRQGNVKDIYVTVSMIPGTEKSVASLLDITERNRYEREMARLDRFNLIGEMAAGIGHEIRNPMTTVRGFLQILRSKKDCAQYKEFYDLMIDELDRANSIITEYLSLAKNKTVDLKEKSLNDILKAIFPLIQAEAIKTCVDVEMVLGELPILLLDEKEIRQVLLNLARNGLEAMSSEGVLTIRTFLDGEEAVLAVRDQGKGIEPEVLKKIGTPFFTTKDNGTGLGLSVCYSIAARHNAAIKVETGPDGTTFFVRFVPGNH